MASRPDSDDSDESLTREQLEELRRKSFSAAQPVERDGLLPRCAQGMRSRAEADRTRRSTVRNRVEDSAELEVALNT
jgi:hypothetical protein